MLKDLDCILSDINAGGEKKVSRNYFMQRAIFEKMKGELLKWQEK
jgi:hypothetical protein